MSNSVKEERWVYSNSEDNFSYSEEFQSKEEAFKAAMEDCNIEGSFYVGKTEEVIPCGVGIESILEDISEETAQGCEFGDDYLMYVDEEHKEELEVKLNEVLFSWMKKYNYLPDWYSVEDIEMFRKENE